MISDYNKHMHWQNEYGINFVIVCHIDICNPEAPFINMV